MRQDTPTPLALLVGKLRIFREYVKRHLRRRRRSIYVFEPSAKKIIDRGIKGYRQPLKDIGACR